MRIHVWFIQSAVTNVTETLQTDCDGLYITLRNWNDSVYDPCVVIRSFSHSWHIIGFVARVTRSGAKNADPSGAFKSTTSLRRVHVARSLLYVRCFVDRCVSFFHWPFYFLSFLDLWSLIYTLVSSKRFRGGIWQKQTCRLYFVMFQWSIFKIFQ